MRLQKISTLSNLLSLNKLSEIEIQWNSEFLQCKCLVYSFTSLFFLELVQSQFKLLHPTITWNLDIFKWLSVHLPQSNIDFDLFNNYFELFVINCRYHFSREITQPLWIINKSIEFELCHMKLGTLKVDPKSNHETCFR